jgi:hypothetical protein
MVEAGRQQHRPKCAIRKHRRGDRPRTACRKADCGPNGWVRKTSGLLGNGAADHGIYVTLSVFPPAAADKGLGRAAADGVPVAGEANGDLVRSSPRRLIVTSMRGCAACGESNPARARFCLGCGHPLDDEPAVAPELRRSISIVFADLVGSTMLGESLDVEGLRYVTGRYFETMRAAVERHEGTVEKFIGDAVVALFGVPRVREDDALRAVRAAADMRASLTVLNGELQRDLAVTLQIRIGVNTGEVIVGEHRAGGSPDR